MYGFESRAVRSEIEPSATSLTPDADPFVAISTADPRGNHPVKSTGHDVAIDSGDQLAFSYRPVGEQILRRSGRHQSPKSRLPWPAFLVMIFDALAAIGAGVVTSAPHDPPDGKFREARQ